MAARTISLPGDKSISHRALILSAMADRPTTIRNIADGVDVETTINVLRSLGVRMESIGRDFKIYPSPFNSPGSDLYCGNSGTTMRVMSGVLSAQSFPTTLSGDSSLNSRPMRRVVDPLRLMGACLSCEGNGVAPIRINPADNGLSGISYNMPVPSAQVKGALLLAGLFAGGETVVIESMPTRDHTERLLKTFSVPVFTDPSSVGVRGGSRLCSPGEISVPGDPSSAAFLAVAALFAAKRSVKFEGVCLNPTRIGWLDILKTMGADIEYSIYDDSGLEPFGEIVVQPLAGARLRGIDISNDGSLPVNQILDEIPIIAVAASVADGKTVIRDASELKIKESDRIEAIVAGISGLGGGIEILDDGMVINGNSMLHGGVVESFGDHRIAMAFNIAALIVGGGVEIKGGDMSDISYRDFAVDLKKVLE